MSTTNPPSTIKHILPTQYYGMYETGRPEVEQKKRTTFSLLRFFWWAERA